MTNRLTANIIAADTKLSEVMRACDLIPRDEIKGWVIDTVIEKVQDVDYELTENNLILVIESLRQGLEKNGKTMIACWFDGFPLIYQLSPKLYLTTGEKFCFVPELINISSLNELKFKFQRLLYGEH